MGGNVFKAITKRISSKEWDESVNEIMNILNDSQVNKSFKLNGLLRIGVNKHYKNKPNHGDIDLVLWVSSDEHRFINQFHNTGKLMNDIFKVLNITQFHKNGNTYSCLYKDNIQLDIQMKVYESEEQIECHKLFYDYNDVGNFIGHLARKLNLKFKPEGLFYRFHSYQNDSYKRDIFITNNKRDIFRILDLEESVYDEGFDDLEDIFKFIIDSNLFNRKSFMLFEEESDNNHSQKHRDKHRKSATEFEKYIIKNNITKSAGTATLNELCQRLFEINLDHYIPELLQTIQKYNFEIEMNQNIKDKFNGNIVAKHFNIEPGKELGDIMTRFNKSFKSEQHRRYFLYVHTTEQILKTIEELLSDEKR